MDDVKDLQRTIIDLENSLRGIKCYVKGWEHANTVKWEPGMLGHDDKARNEMWLAGLHDILNTFGDWIDQPMVFTGIEEEDEGERPIE